MEKKIINELISLGQRHGMTIGRIDDDYNSGDKLSVLFKKKGCEKTSQNADCEVSKEEVN